MTLKRLTRALFLVSDTLAWVLLSLAVLSAASLPFLGFVAERMEHSAVSWPGIIGSSLLSLAVGAGAYGLTRRRPLSLAFVALPSVISGVTGNWLLALAWLVAVVVIFGAPLFLVYREMRSSASGEA